jgi:hypothetical protein
VPRGGGRQAGEAAGGRRPPADAMSPTVPARRLRRDLTPCDGRSGRRRGADMRGGHGVPAEQARGCPRRPTHGPYRASAPAGRRAGGRLPRHARPRRRRHGLGGQRVGRGPLRHRAQPVDGRAAAPAAGGAERVAERPWRRGAARRPPASARRLALGELPLARRLGGGRLAADGGPRRRAGGRGGRPGAGPRPAQHGVDDGRRPRPARFPLAGGLAAAARPLPAGPRRAADRGQHVRVAAGAVPPGTGGPGRAGRGPRADRTPDGGPARRAALPLRTHPALGARLEVAA